MLNKKKKKLCMHKKVVNLNGGVEKYIVLLSFQFITEEQTFL